MYTKYFWWTKKFCSEHYSDFDFFFFALLTNVLIIIWLNGTHFCHGHVANSENCLVVPTMFLIFGKCKY